MKGISMSGALPQRTADGFKTETRRVVRQATRRRKDHPPYLVGERLYVREAHYRYGHWEPVPGKVTTKGRKQKWRFVAHNLEPVLFNAPPEYRSARPQQYADRPFMYKRLARFMPAVLARTVIEVVSVHMERLGEISEADCIAEGVEFTTPEQDEPAEAGGQPAKPARAAFRALWESINGPGSWDPKLWVWVIRFRKVTP